MPYFSYLNLGESKVNVTARNTRSGMYFRTCAITERSIPVCGTSNIIQNTLVHKQRYLKEGRKELFYLTTHSTHLVTVIWRQIYG